MSVVVFPFRDEEPRGFLRNIHAAATHPAVDRIVAVGYEEDDSFRALLEAADVVRKEGAELVVTLQERIGTRRVGKGDGMLTALRWFVEESDAERLHFYDADIVNFGPDWIEQAERAADLGYDVVRHYFPRAATDAMITWMVTRVGFAELWPATELPWIEQPLGGELLLSRRAAEVLWGDTKVRTRSDWGIDTVLTFAAVQQGLPHFETYVPEGKIHRLYGTLADLRTMLCECFAAIQDLQHEPVVNGLRHHIEYPQMVPLTVRRHLGFDAEGSLRFLSRPLSDRQRELLELLPETTARGLVEAARFPGFSFMDEEAWHLAYRHFLHAWEDGDDDWAELLFRAWVARVLHYAATEALRGYDHAMEYLHGMVIRSIHRGHVHQARR